MYAAVEGAKTTRGERPHKKQGGAGCRVVSVCSCVNEEKCQAAEIRWARERSFRRGKVRQKEETRGKACMFTRESAGSVVERAIEMTLKWAEVNEGGA